MAAAAVVAVPGGGRADAAPAQDAAPDLRFSQTEFELHPRAVVWNRHNEAKSKNAFGSDGLPTLPRAHFARVEVNRAETVNGVVYAVEELPDKSDHRVCYRFNSNDCFDLEFGVRDNSGWLFTRVDGYCPNCASQYMEDFEEQRVQLSAKDAGSALKVYREVLVKPPADSPDCADFPDKDVDRYTCLFLRETLPAAPPATTSAMRDSLPGLVQPTDNYSLVFAEEFNGTAEKDPKACYNGMATLDRSIWNFPDHCQRAYPTSSSGAPVPCVNVEDGHFYMSRTSWCGGGMETEGSFQYQYGYLEVKYTVNIRDRKDLPPWYHNYAFFVGHAGLPSLNEFPEYNVALNSYEDMSKYVETEIDVFEFIPRDKMDIFHQYGNFYNTVKSLDGAPRRSVKAFFYCIPRPRYGWYGNVGLFFSPASCNKPTKTVTVTKGVEWTPRGYRTFMKVDGVHDEFQVLQASNIATEIEGARKIDGKVVYYGPRRRYTRGFFEGTGDDILEQIAIGHRPASLWLNAWGHPTCDAGEEPPCAKSADIKTKMQIDYIRIFQPANRYTDMEPVYK